MVGLFATSERIADPQPHPAGRPASAVSIPLLLRRSGVVMAVFGSSAADMVVKL